MGRFDRREPEYCDVLYAILDLSRGGMSRNSICQILKGSGYPIKLDHFFDLISELHLAHVTEDYCKTTSEGTRFVKDCQEIASYLKISPKDKIVLNLIKIFNF